MTLIDPTRWKLIPLDKLIPAIWNYKGEDPVLAAKLAENMKRNGIIESCLVRLLDTGFYEIVNGNHRYAAAMQIGAEGLFCYDLGKITEPEAIRIAIETNETRFQAEAVALSERMKEIAQSFDIADLASTMPYTAEEIESMTKLTDFDWSKFDEVPDPKTGENEQYRTVLLKVPKEVHDMWKEIVTEASDILDYDTDKYPNVEARIFELAVVELKNTLPSLR